MLARRLGAACCAAAVTVSLSACGSSSIAPAPRNTAPGSIAALVNQRVKHVFVIVQENHTFDNYFGLYPGTSGQAVENLGTANAQATDCEPDPESTTGTCQRPFLITTNTASPNYVKDAPDIGAGNNSRYGQEQAVDGGKMDKFLAQNEPAGATPLPAAATTAQTQAHNGSLVVEAAYDCDTVPYLWYYAKNFTLFDHYFQANAGQSTPGNVQLFAAQMGQTEAAAGKGTLSTQSGTGYTDGSPMGNDNNPPDTSFAFRGSYAAQAKPDAAYVQSFATMPVLLNPAQDANAVSASVEGLIPDDIALEAKTTRASVPWAWYEEGFLYPADGTAKGTWSQHHTAPLYFDYINNPRSAFGLSSTLRDNTASNGLLSDVQSGNLPASGVFWVKGGSTATTFPFHPADPALAAAGLFTGDDDHQGSGNSDHQVAQAYVATLVNAIAQSKYWNDSVIILTWDDSGGEFDHLAPPQYGGVCPDDRTGAFAGAACGDGVRLPMLVISPFAKQGVVVHDASDAGSVSKFIEDAFGLPTLASLPDEAQGVAAGLAPADANAMISDLTGALDPAKLNGSAHIIPGAAATIASPSVPPTMSCASLGIAPIASPASLPPGFQTAGYYSAAALNPTSGIRALPAPNDDND